MLLKLAGKYSSCLPERVKKKLIKSIIGLTFCVEFEQDCVTLRGVPSTLVVEVISFAQEYSG
jgi:hypothetical protein